MVGEGLPSLLLVDLASWRTVGDKLMLGRVGLCSASPSSSAAGLLFLLLLSTVLMHVRACTLVCSWLWCHSPFLVWPEVSLWLLEVLLRSSCWAIVQQDLLGAGGISWPSAVEYFGSAGHEIDRERLHVEVAQCAQAYESLLCCRL